MAMATNTQENLAIAMAMAAAPPPGSPRTATALHDFAATSDNELTLTQGMRVIIIDDSDEHWWCCQDAASCHGGFVPASHLSVAGSLKTATALHDFAATVASHMTLTKGMRVWILDDSDEGGWWHCQDAASATHGYVPASHLSAAAVEAAAEPAQEPATQPSPQPSTPSTAGGTGEPAAETAPPPGALITTASKLGEKTQSTGSILKEIEEEEEADIQEKTLDRKESNPHGEWFRRNKTLEVRVLSTREWRTLPPPPSQPHRRTLTLLGSGAGVQHLFVALPGQPRGFQQELLNSTEPRTVQPAVAVLFPLPLKLRLIEAK